MPRTHIRGTPRKKKEDKKNWAREGRAQRKEIARLSRRAFLPSFRELVHNLTCDLARGASIYDPRQRTEESLQIKLMMVSALLPRRRPRALRDLAHWLACLDSVLTDFRCLRTIWEIDQLRGSFGGRIL